MKIAIEMTGALGGGGYRRYVERLVEALTRLYPEHRFVLHAAFRGGFPERATSLNIPKRDNWEWDLIRVPQSLWLPADELGLGFAERRLRGLRVDLVHGACSILPRVSSLPSVMTLHYAGEYPFKGLWNRFYFNRLTDRSTRDAGRVIAPSEFTKSKALETWPEIANRCSVVPHGGPEPEFRPAAPGESAPEGLTFPYLLMVGALRFTKRHAVVVEAFAKLRRKRPDLKLELVFAGGEDEASASVRRVVAEHRLERRVVFLGSVNPAEIPALYRSAWGVVCASVTEGFAFPALEAMACGVPVVAVDGGALPETVGQAGIVVPPSADGIADALLSLASDEVLRADYSGRGKARAASFSWDRTAKETFEIYTKAVKSFRVR